MKCKDCGSDDVYVEVSFESGTAILWVECNGCGSGGTS